MDWQTAPDGTAPEGWKIWNLDEHAADLRNCGNGWNGYAFMQDKGQLYAKMKGHGIATIKYRDCWGEGFAGVYLDGRRIDKSATGTGELRIFRCAACIATF